MKKIIFAGVIAMALNPAFAAESAQLVETGQVTTVTEVRTEKIAFVEKMIELPGLLSAEGKLREAIGIETLAGIVTPIIGSGSVVPAFTALKLGISLSCNCAKLKLFRVPLEPGKKPVEISYDAIRGFSADNKTVNINLEVMADSRLHLKVETPAHLAPGQFLEWMPAQDMPPPKVPEVQVQVAAPETQQPDKIQTWEIADHFIDCQGVAPMKCLFIKKSENEVPEAFYDSIMGFEYKEGFDYVIKVKEAPVMNPPADASSLAYSLVEMVSQKSTAVEKASPPSV